MTAIRSLHSKIFERLIAEHRLMLIEGLIAGTPDDHPAYRQIVGRLQGITDALKISEQADYELSGDESDGGA